MNLTRFNNIAYKSVCIIISIFLALVSLGLIIMHLYFRSLVEFGFAATLIYRATKPASIKAWLITIILSAIGLAAVDLYVAEKPDKLLSVGQAKLPLPQSERT